MSNFENQIDRMKAMMNYGLQTENKGQQYKSVEYQKKGADGKTYGIVREGTKFYIKVSDSAKDNLVKEDFNYIGGFVNRKNNEYTSYANALKNFDMKMASIKEACGNKDMVIESWDPEKNEYLVLEATDSMKKEIARQRAIMSNASRIVEGKACCCDGEECGKVKSNIKNEKPQTGDATKVNDGFSEDPKAKDMEGVDKNEDTNIKESAEPLAWHKEGGDAKENIADTYMDKSHGTEIGDSAPFDEKVGSEGEMKNGTVEEEVAMHAEGENQNSPEPRVAEVGDSAPFEDKVNEAVEECGLVEDDDEELDDLGDDVETEDFEEGGDDFEDDELDAEEDFDGEDFGDEEEDELEPVEDEVEEGDAEIESLKDEISQLKDMISTLMDKVGVPAEDTAEIEFEDEPLYDGDEDGEGEEEIEFEDEVEEPEDDDFEVYESRSYKKMMHINEDRLDDFGKHPAYQKKVMELPPTGEDENEHGRDWNDDSVHSEEPYGTKIGSSAPFKIQPQKIDNAIAEAVKKVLGKGNF